LNVTHVAYCIYRDERYTKGSNLDRRLLLQNVCLIGCSALASGCSLLQLEIVGMPEAAAHPNNWDIELPEAADIEVQILIILFVENIVHN
jgi:hypothetical protein